MKIEITPLNRLSVQEFAEQYGLTMKVNERTTDFWPNGRWFARFDGLEIKDGSCLISSFGNGRTVDEAIEAYCDAISEQYGVIGAYSDSRKEIYKIPILHYEKEQQ